VLDRIGKGLRTPARDAIIADVTPPEIRGRAFGFHRGADHFGSVPGSLLAWWLLEHAVDVRQVLTWSVAPGVLAGLVLLLVLRDPRASQPSVSRNVEGAKEAGGRTFWAPVIALAALTLLRAPETLLILRLQDLGVPVPTIPLVWAGLHVVRTAVSYPGGWLSDRFGSRRMVAAGGVMFAAAVGALGAPIGVRAAVAAFLAMGLVAGLTESAERSLVAQLAPKRTGRGFGAYHAVTGMAVLPAATGFGFLYAHAGATAALTASASCVLAGSVAWLAIIRGYESVRQADWGPKRAR
jgi:MFS family permease